MAEIDGSIKALVEKLQTAESALESLERDLARIEEDLAIKTKSLALDNRCMDIRKKLTNPDFIPDQSVEEVTQDLSRLSPGADRESLLGEVIDKDTVEFRNAVASPKLQETYNYSDVGRIKTVSPKPGSKLSGRDLLETTYNASYEIGSNNLRSGDLARTLGRSGQQTVTRRKELLID